MLKMPKINIVLNKLNKKAFAVLDTDAEKKERLERFEQWASSIARRKKNGVQDKDALFDFQMYRCWLRRRARVLKSLMEMWSGLIPSNGSVASGVAAGREPWGSSVLLKSLTSKARSLRIPRRKVAGWHGARLGPRSARLT